MAKLYALTEADRRTQMRMLRWFNSGGSGKSGRPTPTRRRQLTPGTVSAKGSTAMLIADVPAATIDGAAFTSTPGKGADDAAHILRWKLDTAADPPETIHPMEDLEPAEEVDPDAPPPVPPATPSFIPVTRAPINHSKTIIRASPGEPILVSGVLERRDDKEVFVISSVMDLRALPGFAVGTAPTTGDDALLQIPFHSGGAEDFKLDSADCGA